MTKAVTILPLKKPVRGEISITGDKSISHRAVMLGAIAEGDTVIRGFLYGADNRATVAAFRAMGLEIEEGFEKGAKTLIVHGTGLRGLREPDDIINALNSGTTARLLTGLLCGQSFFSVITGDDSLRTRPMKRIVEPLSLMGGRISGRVESTLLPLAITPSELKGINYSTPVASAQLKSSILLAGLYARGRTSVTEPALSRNHTETMLKAMGADITVDNLTVTISGERPLKGIHIDVPGDISSAAFLMVAALIVPESRLLIKGVGVNPTRMGIIHILKKMGGDITLLNLKGDGFEPRADILVSASNLKGINITGTELLPAIDEFPIITIAAAFAEGSTGISGAGELRVKESDRISVMRGILRGMGVSCEEAPDGLSLEGREYGTLGGGSFNTRGDHRVAMSLAVAALGAREEVTIEDGHSVDVSYPGFFTALHEISRTGK